MINDYSANVFTQFNDDWPLLAAGTMDSHNAMTIGWGGLGTLWSKPVAFVFVRTSRYTHEFMDANEYFTVSFYPEEYRQVLERFVGPADALVCGETLQIKDYSETDWQWTLFDPAARQKRREEAFPQYLKAAFDKGVKLAER